MDLLKTLIDLTSIKEAHDKPLEEAKNSSMSELVDRFLDHHQIHNFEMSRGERNFLTLIKTLDPSYDSLSDFFHDNSGAYEALVEWIKEQGSEEWISNLRSATEGEEDPNDQHVEEQLEEAKKWSGRVVTKKHPPIKLFAEGSVEKIVAWLRREHKDLRGAMSSLNFYLNRAGKNLSAERLEVLDRVKQELSKTKKVTKKESK